MTERDYPTDPLAKGGVREDPERVTCDCDDEAAHEVAALITHGMSQREACLQVYGRSEARRSLTASIRASFLAKWPDIRLPDMGGA